MAYVPARLTATKAATTNPAYTVPQGLSAYIKNATIVNTGTTQSLTQVRIVGLDVLVLSIVTDPGATNVFDGAVLLVAGESISVVTTGGSAADSVHVTISGATF